ncbi:MAG: hypothetical protein ABI990_07705 [Actinomycetota bacterium]
MNELLEELVPPFDATGDWNDVLRRAGRRRLWPRAIAAFAVVGAAIAVAPALALLHRDGVGLPKAADRSNVAVILAPKTGRVLLQIAPWKGHDGFCYLVLRVRAGCVPHKARGTVFLKPPLMGWTFDDRVVSGTATGLGGRHIPLTVTHLAKLDVTIFLIRDRLPRLFRSAVLRDGAGHVVARVNWRH